MLEVTEPPKFPEDHFDMVKLKLFSTLDVTQAKNASFSENDL